MRIIDRRHHATPSQEDRATCLIEELAHRAMAQGWHSTHSVRNKTAPGAFIRRLPDDQRATLKGLTSDGINQISVPYLLQEGSFFR